MVSGQIYSAPVRVIRRSKSVACCLKRPRGVSADLTLAHEAALLEFSRLHRQAVAGLPAVFLELPQRLLNAVPPD